MTNENRELINRIEAEDQWDMDDCKAVCEAAGLEEEWDAADGETFEAVVYKAIEILKA